jgi:predicted NBD/HSP70 family sugar kinase
MTPASVVAPASWSSGAMLVALRASRGASRSELARISGLSISTVSTRLQPLIDAGLVEESSPDMAATGPGRPSKLLTVSGRAGTILAVELSLHHAALSTMDFSGGMRALEKRELDLTEDPDVVTDRLAERVLAALQHDGSAAGLSGVAVSVPGPIDATRRQVVAPSRLPGWSGFRLADALSDRLEVPVLIENDANAMAVGERVGQAPAVDDLVFVKASSGIGCGIICKGELYRGATGLAGDISHVRLGAGSDVACGCGLRGCLEATSSGAALVRDLSRAGLELASPAEVVSAAAAGVEPVARAVREAGQLLGEALAGVVSFFNPELVIVGGVLGELELYLTAVRAGIYGACSPIITQQLEVRGPTGGPDVALLGVGTLLLDELLCQTRVDAQLAVRPEPA